MDSLFFFFLHIKSEVRTLGFDVLVQYFTSNNFIVNVGWLVGYLIDYRIVDHRIGSEGI